MAEALLTKLLCPQVQWSLGKLTAALDRSIKVAEDLGSHCNFSAQLHFQTPAVDAVSANRNAQQSTTREVNAGNHWKGSVPVVRHYLHLSLFMRTI